MFVVELLVSKNVCTLAVLFYSCPSGSVLGREPANVTLSWMGFLQELPDYLLFKDLTQNLKAV